MNRPDQQLQSLYESATSWADAEWSRDDGTRACCYDKSGGSALLGATCVTWKVGTVLPHLSTTVVILHDCTRLCLQTQLGSLSHVMLIHDDHDVVAMGHVRKL